MKRFRNILIVTLSLSLFAACEDFLEVNNYGGIPSDDFVTSVDNAQYVVNGAYSGLYGLQLWRSQIYYYLDFATNELEYRKTDGNLKNLTNFGYKTEQNFIKDYWRSLYRLIARSDDACSKIWRMTKDNGIMNNFTEAQKTETYRLIGECCFLRGLGYFYLVRSFGDKLPSHPEYDPAGLGIPIRDTLVSEKEQLMRPRNTLKESWDEVIRNFETAYQYLPAQWGADKIGAATKGAAAAYLGEVYMYFKEYGEAKTWFDRAIEAGNYALTEKYDWNFDLAHENNSESIFEVQFDNTNSDEIGNYMWRNFGPDPKWWGDVNVSQEYVDKFSDGYMLSQKVYDDLIANPKNYISLSNPQKLLAIFVRLGFGGAIGKRAANKQDFMDFVPVGWDELAEQIDTELQAQGVAIARFNVKKDDPSWGTENSKYLKVVFSAAEQDTDPRLYATCYVPNRDSLSNYWDGHDTYMYTNSYYGFKKYIPYNSIEDWASQGLPGFQGNNPINQRILRLAEVYLFYAEIYYRQNDPATAAEYVNKVRRRAWGKPIDQISEYDYDTSEGDLLSVIVKEREKELCLEGRLFFDYLRLGLDRELFASRGYNPEIHHRLPIPQAERQIVGMDKLLQNEGY